MNYELTSPASPRHWDAYHAIRRVILFERRGRFGVYNPRHPDEIKPSHFPKLLLFEKKPVGVIRIDIDGEVARFRRVAIAAEQQGRGHRRTLLRLSETFSIEHEAARVEASRSSIDGHAPTFAFRPIARAPRLDATGKA